MGTRGYIVIKFKDLYYVVYNHMDSYPEILGIKVVDLIKSRKVEENMTWIYFIFSHFKNKVFTTLHAPEPSLHIEWVYTINLNTSSLHITGGYYIPRYNIYDISDTWLGDFHEKNEKMVQKKKR